MASSLQAPVDYCDPPDSPECVAGTWYSLIGACPLESLYKKSDACKQQHPGWWRLKAPPQLKPLALLAGAMCKDPDGTPHCTYAARYAGQVSLDELIGAWQGLEPQASILDAWKVFKGR